MPKIIVDGNEMEVKADANLLEALLSAGIDIPYFCWHPAMGSVGACRQCAVVGYANEDDTLGRIVMSCMTPVTEGARFSVDAENATLFRTSVIENLMLNHPHDCPVCEEGGECHLQDMTVMVGHSDRRYEGQKTTFNNQYLGPFIGHEMNRCITCYRCVRYYQDYAGGNDLNAFGSRDRVFFGRAEPGVLENEFAGNLVEVCPTGVFTDKTLSKNYTRKWDLQSSPTICQGCSLGCNTYSSERYGELRRVHNRYHNEINGYFLCDRGRFGGQHVNSPKRIPQAGIRNVAGLYDATEMDEALTQASAMIRDSERVVGIGSPRASLEANQALRQLVGADNYCNGMNDTEREMHQILLEVQQSNLSTPSLGEVADHDAIIIIGEDATNHAPMLALSIRQAVRNRAKELSDGIGLAQWHDAAVRELAQNDRSPLVIMTPMADRLDDVASNSLRLAPVEIISLVKQVAESIDHAEPSRAKQIADLLVNARRPLIVSGTSLASPDIIRASVNLALAIQKKNPRLSLFLAASECNSLGVALIDNQHSMEELLTSQPDTVIVLENDLAARLGVEFNENINQLITLDYLDNATVSQSNIVLPAASFAESDGTFVNNEGRVQRSLAVFKPKGDITPSYQMLTRLAGEQQSASSLQHTIADEYPLLQPIVACAPDADFRVEGNKVPRMTPRASGRTAMLADKSVHEPQQPVDTESAMAFTMEGSQGQAPASLRAFTWSPGWNSNQSIHKFQSEVGGADKTEVPGIRLFPSSGAFTEASTLPGYTLDGTLDGSLDKRSPGQLTPQHHIFGSDPVSAQAEELSSLIPGPYVRMNPAMAASLEVAPGDGLHCQSLGLDLAVIVDESVADDCATYPVIEPTIGLAGVRLGELTRIDNWQAPIDPLRPNLITSDLFPEKAR